MNALELADELEDKFGNANAPKQYAIIKEAINELRRQAKEIQDLKK
jgi:hypothetical protein